jgi:hypothetical protein
MPGESLLIVDDDRFVHEALEAAIEGRGLNVLSRSRSWYHVHECFTEVPGAPGNYCSHDALVGTFLDCPSKVPERSGRRE